MSSASTSSRVVLMPTSTEKNINTSPTAASAGTDLNGTAAVRACRAIKRRLRRFAAGRLADAPAGLGAVGVARAIPRRSCVRQPAAG